MINSFSDEYRFLSNFYLSPITMDGIVYPTVEHYFQAMKTEEITLRKEIAEAYSPGRAKRMGRKLLLRKDWETLKITVMLKGLIEKFTTYPELQAKLIATAPHQLIEGNTWGDKYWGICNGEGQNLLGLMLMLLRSTLLPKENIK
jgi:ribA/ribD-fused uncharacterized protein